MRRSISLFMSPGDAARFARTNRLNHQLIESFRKPHAQTSIARQLNLSEAELHASIRSNPLKMEASLSPAFDSSKVQTLNNVSQTHKEVICSKNGKFLVTTSLDKSFYVWQQNDEKRWQPTLLPGSSHPQPHTTIRSSCNPVYFSPDSKHILGLVGDLMPNGTIRTQPHVWSLNSANEWIESAVLGNHEDSCLSAEFSNDGQHIVTSGLDGYVRLFQKSEDNTWQETSTLHHPRAEWLRTFTNRISVNWARLSDDNRQLLTFGADQITRLWERSEEPTWALSETFRGYAMPPKFLAKNQLLLIAPTRLAIVEKSPKGDWETKTELNVEAAHFASSIEVSHDGKHIALVPHNEPQTVKIWSYDENNWTLSAQLTGHDDRINSVKFADNNLHLLTTSNDKSIRVWFSNHQNDQWRSLATLEGHEHAVTSANFNTHVQGIVSIAHDTRFGFDNTDSTLKYWHR